MGSVCTGGEIGNDSEQEVSVLGDERSQEQRGKDMCDSKNRLQTCRLSMGTLYDTYSFSVQIKMATPKGGQYSDWHTEKPMSEVTGPGTSGSEKSPSGCSLGATLQTGCAGWDPSSLVPAAESESGKVGGKRRPNLPYLRGTDQGTSSTVSADCLLILNNEVVSPHPDQCA